ncbi:hypothetical protein SH661x_002415 [Planctomicrobium sp. SH661]|uniref:hypothetical protein n=1 Tax=Planctomicrobium sp. SH661 TaxID=3448124 RepID=UPI003F5C25A2
MKLTVTVSLLALVIASGCAKDPFRTVPVSGRVTSNGEPVPGVYVVFTPQPGSGREANVPGKSGAGYTDENGKFQLSTYGDGDGAVVATHSVAVLLNTDPSNPHLEKSKKLMTPYLQEKQTIEILKPVSDLEIKYGN